MAMKFLKSGESFSFPSEFGFTGSTKGQSAPRAHPQRSANEFGDGMAKGGKVTGHARGGATAPPTSAPRPAARAHHGGKKSHGPKTVPAATAKKAALGALKIGAMMGAKAAAHHMAPPGGAPGGGLPVHPPMVPPVAPPAPALARPVARPPGPPMLPPGPPPPAPGGAPPMGAIPGMAKGGKFIQKMGLKKGALHRQLGIPEAEKIPQKRLQQATHSSNPLLAKRARTAQTLGSLSHKNKA